MQNRRKLGFIAGSNVHEQLVEALFKFLDFLNTTQPTVLAISHVVYPVGTTYVGITLVTAVLPTLGPQLGITEDMLDSSPPAKSRRMSDGSGMRDTGCRFIARLDVPGEDLGLLQFGHGALGALVDEIADPVLGPVVPQTGVAGDGDHDLALTHTCAGLSD